MKYFSPETSKKLEELGLKNTVTSEIQHGAGVEFKDGWLHAYSTLDICEIENAKKLWGDDDVAGFQLPTQDMPMPWYQYQQVLYITLSDEERVKYVEDYIA